MNCKKCEKLVYQFFDHESSKDLALIKEHFLTCSSCSDQYEDQIEISHLLSSNLKEIKENTSIPPELLSNIVSQVDQEEEKFENLLYTHLQDFKKSVSIPHDLLDNILSEIRKTSLPSNRPLAKIFLFSLRSRLLHTAAAAAIIIGAYYLYDQPSQPTLLLEEKLDRKTVTGHSPQIIRSVLAKNMKSFHQVKTISIAKSFALQSKRKRRTTALYPIQHKRRTNSYAKLGYQLKKLHRSKLKFNKKA